MEGNESERSYRRLFEQVPVGVYRATREGRIVAANPALLQMLGYDSLEELARIDLASDLYLDPDARSKWQEAIEREGRVTNVEAVLVRKDGRRIVVLDSASVIDSSVDGISHYEGTLTDITELKRAQQVQSVLLRIFEAAATTSDLGELLATVQKQLARLLDTSNFYVALYDDETGLYSFPFHLDEYEPSEQPAQTLPKSLTDYVRRTGEPLLANEATHQQLIDEGEVELVGVASPVWLGVPLRSGDGDEVLGVVAVQSYRESSLYSQEDLDLLAFVSDNIALAIQRKRAEMELKQREKRLDYLARYDALTGLPNRVLFEDRLGQALMAARRNGERIALHHLDIDEFQQVNDALGHSVGDKLLKAAGRRLAGLVRQSDTVARLGGDEFALIQVGIEGATGASAFAARVLEAMSAPFDVVGHELHTSSSIGVTLSSSGDGPEELQLQADQALHKAKEKGGGCFHFHDEQLADEVHRYISVRQDLDGAVERGEFRLDYQPQVDLTSGTITGCEALVRWHHPRRGLLQPGDFIPVTEKTGLIIPIGAWVLREACRQRREWCDAGLRRIPIAVNLSAVQFRDPSFEERLNGVLDTTGVQPGLLELELTETVLMQSANGVRKTLHRSHDRGVSIAIDDFGTGYSSLRYLREFPIGRLKIAMQFVQGVTEDTDDAAIVAAVISLGHQLGMKVIAEGVETAEQVAFLAEHGCDEAQGFYFARPLAAGALAERLDG